MLVTWTPEDGSKQEWTFVPGKVPASRGQIIEKLSGRDYDDWRTEVLDGSSLLGRRVLLWHLQSLTHPTIRFDDVDFLPDELTVEAQVADYLWMREIVASGMLGTGMTEADRADRIAMLDTLIEGAAARESDSGKAGSPTSSGTTDPPSPTSSESDPGSNVTF